MTTNRTGTPTTIFVVPCGGQKLDRPAAARDLYTSHAFQYALAGALAEADGDAKVMILSAKYGLVDLDTVLAPYDVKMGDPDSITVDDLAVSVFDATNGRPVEFYAFLPIAYRARLAAAADLAGSIVFDVFEAAPGTGYQRGVYGSLDRTRDAVTAA